MERIVNKTGMQVTIVEDNGRDIWTFPAEGVPASMTEQHRRVGSLPVSVGNDETVLVSIDRLELIPPILPEPTLEMGYIVSGAVASALPNRHDLVVPYQPVRDEDGHHLGYRGFALVGGAEEDEPEPEDEPEEDGVWKALGLL